MLFCKGYPTLTQDGGMEKNYEIVFLDINPNVFNTNKIQYQ